MPNIREDLVGVVHLYVDGESYYLSAGDEVPGDVKIREDVLAGSTPLPEEGFTEAPAEPVTDVDEVADIDEALVPDEDMPAESAPREAWNTYAESIGFDPSPYSKKETLIEALKQR